MDAAQTMTNLEQHSPYYRELRNKQMVKSQPLSVMSRTKALDAYWLHRQKQIIDCFRKEINTIAQIAEQNNIKITFTRGATLADDLYPVPEIRPFGDIDALVHIDDIGDFIRICKSLGYSYDQVEGDSEEEALARSIRLIENWNHNHFKELNKKVKTKLFEFNIFLEVHTQLYARIHQARNIDENTLTLTALNATIPHPSSLYQSVYVLQPMDNLLALIAHEAKHFLDAILSSISENGKLTYSYNLLKLIDIDLHFEKYHCDINVLLQKAIDWDLVPECVLILRIMELYVPEKFIGISLMSVYEKHCRGIGFFDFAINLILMNSQFNELVHLDNKQLATYVIQHLKIEKPLVNCYESDTYEGLPMDAVFTIDETADDIPNRFGTHVKVRNWLDPDMRWSCVGVFRRDKTRLWLKLDVQAASLYLEGASENADYLVLYLLNHSPAEDHPFIRKIKVLLCMDVDKSSLNYGKPFIRCQEYDFLDKHEEDIPAADVVHHFKVDGSNYILELGFSLDFIESSVLSNEIIFDIDAYIIDSTPRLSVLSFASNMHYIESQDISSFACLRLIEN